MRVHKQEREGDIRVWRVKRSTHCGEVTGRLSNESKIVLTVMEGENRPFTVGSPTGREGREDRTVLPL
ncbi:hypothetical protein TIFTF001_038886 [Ficus carica]|uniref:Uncharacterized protein n=1 Tax=Ficus carica TaxID=3494 RepID=A0AA88E8V3_FICCA|nr:hypothetical protein TIFTF001_038880 [Ficus carica]GMN69836.1 hypothetical protein TIFTF001_038882 [Ficus carica]GMN69839.1 hypothetical protein TIFTF001_038884 [Ficus carica]GMN69840.1 hypothetical protein TIFTF001_038886 [Ficus carica]